MALPDRSAGNRPTTLALIHQSVKDLSRSRRTNRPARVPCRLRPLHERLLSPATGLLLALPAPYPPGRPFPIPVTSLSSAPSIRFGGFGLSTGLSVSVDRVSSSLETCWNLGASGLYGQRLTLKYLCALRGETDGLYFDASSLLSKAKTRIS